MTHITHLKQEDTPFFEPFFLPIVAVGSRCHRLTRPPHRQYPGVEQAKATRVVELVAQQLAVVRDCTVRYYYRTA